MVVPVVCSLMCACNQASTTPFVRSFSHSFNLKFDFYLSLLPDFPPPSSTLLPPYFPPSPPPPRYLRFEKNNIRSDGFSGSAMWEGMTAEDCGRACEALENCVGFVRDVGTHDSAKGTCYGRTSGDAAMCGRQMLNADWASYIRKGEKHSCSGTPRSLIVHPQ